MKERAAFINVSQENKLSVAYDAPTRERLSAALDFLPGVLLIVWALAIARELPLYLSYLSL